MKPNYILIFLILLCGINNTACDKKYPPFPDDPPVSEGSRLKVVWIRNFHSDKMGGELFLDPIFWNDYVIVSSSHGSHYSKQRGIRVMHKITGEDHPAWNHEPGGVVDYGHFMEDIHIGGDYNNILFTGDSPYLYAVDLNTGQRLWKISHSPNAGIHKFSMLGNIPFQIYHPPSGGLSTSWCRIAICDLNTGDKRDLIEMNIEDNYEFLLDPPAWTTNASGDTIILFLLGGWNFRLVKDKTEAYCYNMTQKEMVWERKNFVERDDAGFETPFITHDNRVVFKLLRSLHCFDISTGELVWQYIPVPMEGYSATPMLYRDGKIYIRCESGIVTCLDSQTGTVLWKTGKNYIPAPDGRMDIYDGKLYLAAWGGRMDIYDGKLYLAAWGDNVEFYLYCLSIETGELLWKDKGPFNKISGGLIIDQNTGYLYCANNREIMCIDLNRSPKIGEIKK